MGNKTVVVIGAVNMDICGRPDKEPNMRDSNPGTVSFTPGGVGRNIAHNLCLLGVGVKFIAAIGDDVYGSSIYESCEKLGMDMHMCRRMKGGRTSSYLYITDEKGDMLLGVNDTDISGSITPEYLGRHLRELNAADAVVIDANLTKETLSWIGENVTSDLYADPVSVLGVCTVNIHCISVCKDKAERFVFLLVGCNFNRVICFFASFGCVMRFCNHEHTVCKPGVLVKLDLRISGVRRSYQFRFVSALFPSASVLT